MHNITAENIADKKTILKSSGLKTVKNKLWHQEEDYTTRRRQDITGDVSDYPKRSGEVSTSSAQSGWISTSTLQTGGVPATPVRMSGVPTTPVQSGGVSDIYCPIGVIGAYLWK